METFYKTFLHLGESWKNFILQKLTAIYDTFLKESPQKFEKR